LCVVVVFYEGPLWISQRWCGAMDPDDLESIYAFIADFGEDVGASSGDVEEMAQPSETPEPSEMYFPPPLSTPEPEQVSAVEFMTPSHEDPFSSTGDVEWNPMAVEPGNIFQIPSESTSVESFNEAMKTIPDDFWSAIGDESGAVWDVGSPPVEETPAAFMGVEEPEFVLDDPPDSSLLAEPWMEVSDEGFVNPADLQDVVELPQAQASLEWLPSGQYQPSWSSFMYPTSPLMETPAPEPGLRLTTDVPTSSKPTNLRLQEKPYPWWRMQPGFERQVRISRLPTVSLPAQSADDPHMEHHGLGSVEAEWVNPSRMTTRVDRINQVFINKSAEGPRSGLQFRMQRRRILVGAVDDANNLVDADFGDLTSSLTLGVLAPWFLKYTSIYLGMVVYVLSWEYAFGRAVSMPEKRTEFTRLFRDFRDQGFTVQWAMVRNYIELLTERGESIMDLIRVGAQRDSVIDMLFARLPRKVVLRTYQWPSWFAAFHNIGGPAARLATTNLSVRPGNRELYSTETASASAILSRQEMVWPLLSIRARLLFGYEAGARRLTWFQALQLAHHGGFNADYAFLLPGILNVHMMMAGEAAQRQLRDFGVTRSLSAARPTTMQVALRTLSSAFLSEMLASTGPNAVDFPHISAFLELPPNIRNTGLLTLQGLLGEIPPHAGSLRIRILHILSSLSALDSFGSLDDMMFAASHGAFGKLPASGVATDGSVRSTTVELVGPTHPVFVNLSLLDFVTSHGPRSAADSLYDHRRQRRVPQEPLYRAFWRTRFPAGVRSETDKNMFCLNVRMVRRSTFATDLVFAATEAMLRNMRDYTSRSSLSFMRNVINKKILHEEAEPPRVIPEYRLKTFVTMTGYGNLLRECTFVQDGMDAMAAALYGLGACCADAYALERLQSAMSTIVPERRYMSTFVHGVVDMTLGATRGVPNALTLWSGDEGYKQLGTRRDLLSLFVGHRLAGATLYRMATHTIRQAVRELAAFPQTGVQRSPPRLAMRGIRSIVERWLSFKMTLEESLNADTESSAVSSSSLSGDGDVQSNVRPETPPPSSSTSRRTAETSPTAAAQARRNALLNSGSLALWSMPSVPLFHYNQGVTEPYVHLVTKVDVGQVSNALRVLSAFTKGWRDGLSQANRTDAYMSRQRSSPLPQKRPFANDRRYRIGVHIDKLPLAVTPEAQSALSEVLYGSTDDRFGVLERREQVRALSGVWPYNHDLPVSVTNQRQFNTLLQRLAATRGDALFENPLSIPTVSEPVSMLPPLLVCDRFIVPRGTSVDLQRTMPTGAPVTSRTPITAWEQSNAHDIRTAGMPSRDVLERQVPAAVVSQHHVAIPVAGAVQMVVEPTIEDPSQIPTIGDHMRVPAQIGTIFMELFNPAARRDATEMPLYQLNKAWGIRAPVYSPNAVIPRSNDLGGMNIVTDDSAVGGHVVPELRQALLERGEGIGDSVSVFWPLREGVATLQTARLRHRLFHPLLAPYHYIIGPSEAERNQIEATSTAFREITLREKDPEWSGDTPEERDRWSDMCRNISAFDTITPMTGLLQAYVRPPPEVIADTLERAVMNEALKAKTRAHRLLEPTKTVHEVREELNARPDILFKDVPRLTSPIHFVPEEKLVTADERLVTISLVVFADASTLDPRHARKTMAETMSYDKR